MASGSGRGMTSLYADLLGPNSSASDQQPSAISKSPVAFAPGEAQTPASDTIGSSDLFQPIPRRPQQPQSKGVKRAGISTFAKPSKAEITNEQQDTSTAATSRAPLVTSTLEDWRTNDDDDVNGFYGGNSRQRGGRKRRKKNRDKEFERVSQSWDDIYDPSRPNLYEEYKDSEERDQEMRDWRDRLYGRRRAFSSDDSDDERTGFVGRSKSDSKAQPHSYHLLKRSADFAPPPNLNFAPPPNLDQPPPDELQNEPAPMFDAATGDEVWMMRARMTQQAPAQTSSLMSAPRRSLSPVPLETEALGSEASPEPAHKIGGHYQPAKSDNRATATISRAPVIYSLPPAPPEIPSEEQFSDAEGDVEDALPTDPEDNAARSTRPGQKGFAERLMSKYGWTKGTGLGANSSGMVHALQVKAAKGKDSKGIGKILDKNKRRAEDADGKFGKMSEVVVLHSMVDGLESEDRAVLMQEIGDECSEKVSVQLLCHQTPSLAANRNDSLVRAH
ncbi:hypothetical protein ABW19_dt0208816 [Dactylella cylindrospora]|nr:hypothetical protein ABW19_dt0208816 [Dactylella cylindrospora]